MCSRLNTNDERLILRKKPSFESGEQLLAGWKVHASTLGSLHDVR